MTISAVQNSTTNSKYEYNATSAAEASTITIPLNGKDGEKSKTTEKNDVLVNREVNYAKEKIDKVKKENNKEKDDTAKLSIDKETGNIIILLKKGISANDLKKLYNIPDGILQKYNDLPYTEAKGKDENHHVKDYGNPQFNKDTKITVPAGSFESAGNVKELFRALGRLL